MCPAHLDSDSSYAEPKSKRLRNKLVKSLGEKRSEKKLKTEDGKSDSVSVVKTNKKLDLKPPATTVINKNVKKSPIISAKAKNATTKPKTSPEGTKPKANLGSASTVKLRKQSSGITEQSSKNIDGLRGEAANTSSSLSLPEQTDKTEFFESSVYVLRLSVQLLIERKERLNKYMFTAECMILGIKSVKQIISLMYSWITQNKRGTYAEAYSAVEREQRLNLVINVAQRVLENHEAAIEKLGLKEQNSMERIACVNHSKISVKSTPLPPYISQLIRTEEKKEIAASNDLSLMNDHFLYLTSPFVKYATITHWNPRELVLFEVCLCRFGCDFTSISCIIQTKSYKECYLFYAEVFKQTSRYLIFKDFKKYAAWYGM